jgi:CTP:molybdopterin cytidylyltransferase MocA
MLILTTLLVTAFVVWAQHGILASKSSTAGIAYFFLPFYTLAATFICAGVSWALAYVVFFILETMRSADNRVTNLPLLLAAVFALTVSGWMSGRYLHQQRLARLAASPQTPAGELSRLQSRALRARNTRVLEKLADNPALADADLAELFKVMVSGGNFKVLGALADNPRLSAAELAQIYELVKNQTQVNGYETWRELARNRNTPPEILQALADMDVNYVRLCVGTNPSTPPATLAQLTADRDDRVRT